MNNKIKTEENMNTKDEIKTEEKWYWVDLGDPDGLSKVSRKAYIHMLKFMVQSLQSNIDAEEELDKLLKLDL